MVKVVLVGIGGYGNTIVAELLAKPNSLVNLVGVVDPYPERCRCLDQLKARKVPIYSDMEEFYADLSADLAVISTPIFLHTQHMLTALKHGSHVLCEKPLCSDEKDILLLEEAQKKSGKNIYIGYQWAFSEPVTRLKNDILDGKFGSLKEMKTLVLRPRDRAYFERGVGWAGKIKMPDGRLVYDSVANNSAAHYLFNMLFVMGEYGKAAVPKNVSGELYRANSIENFDICKIDFHFDNGAKASFIAAHPVQKGIEPVFEYQFENGTVYYACMENDEVRNLMPEAYAEYGQIVAIMHDGEKIVYGDPMADRCRKFYVALQAISEGKKDKGPCGLEAAAVHTRLINKIQKECVIQSIDPACLREDNNFLYAEGLLEETVSCYNDISKSLAVFADNKEV